MKKLTVIAFAFASFGFLATEANAQSATGTTTTPAATTTTTTATEATSTQSATTTEAGKEKIEEAQLPEAVKTSIKADAFKDWKVAEIYKVAPAAAAGTTTATYEIYFTNAEQKRAIARFDETGKPIRSAAATTGAAGSTGTQE